MKKVLAFDIGGTNCRLALINEKFEVEKVEIRPTPTQSVKKFMDNIIDMVESFPKEDVVAIGAGVPGVVDPKTSYIIDLPNVHIKDIAFGEILSKKFNVPVFLRNDAQLACLGEAYLGAGKRFNRVFFITISTGLGGSLCIDSHIQDYVNEVGHTLFKYKDTVQEYEWCIGGCHIDNLAKLNNINISNAKEMFDGVRNNDKDSLILFNEWLECLNKYISLMVNSYLPEIIVVTGGLTKSKDLFFDKIKEANPNVIIEECQFKEDAGLMGAGVYALQCAKII